MDTPSNIHLPDSKCTVMFADIAGSTRMYDTLGDTEAERQIKLCIQTMADITTRNQGHVIKTIGDEIMTSFDSADAAAQTAIEIQTSISDNPSNALSIRIGLQYGNVIIREGDIFGDAVNVAARMTGIAKALQIITTKDLLDQLSNKFADRTRLFDLATVKGKESELQIYQINWEEETKVTQFATSHDIKKISKSTQAVVLKTNGQEFIYTNENFNSAVSIGKDESCDITVDAKYASRSHLNLEYRRGKFVLIDHSTNGTYMQYKGQNELFIRREELTLMGEGCISMGEAVTENTQTNITFSILQNNQSD